jgi:CheY-like chemotaxis protein
MRREVPTMTNAPLEGLSILIVDGQSLSAADISSRLSALGARVHVVTTAARAAAVVRAKRLDVALIGHGSEDAPLSLQKTLDQYGVPYVITATASQSHTGQYERIF